MTMFSSRPQFKKVGETTVLYSAGDRDYRGSFAQTNPTNPILVSQREKPSSPAATLWFIDTILDGAKPDAETDHARRVLNRLANFTKEESA